MRHIFFTLLFMLICSGLFAQVPSVTYLDNPVGNSEEYPVLYPASTGGFYMTNYITKSSPDSMFACVTYLDASLAPQWTRVLKHLAKVSIYSLQEEPNGNITLLMNAYNVTSRYYPSLYTLDQSGATVGAIEIADSSISNPYQVPVDFHLRLANGNRVLMRTAPSEIVHINGITGKVDYSSQLLFENKSNQFLKFNSAASFPGTNQWFAAGYIMNTNLGFTIRMEDTTLLNFHVYNFRPLSSSSTFRNLKILPGNEVQLAWGDNSRMLHLVRIDNTGEIIWRKSWSLPLQSLSTLTVTSNGDIWMSGAITPGQAGGVLAHFSPTGEFLGKKGQLAGGVSLGSMSGVAELPGNELVITQRGYYNSSPTVIMNKIHQSMDFYCFDSGTSTYVDTTYAIDDSVSTALTPFKKSIRIVDGFSFPVRVQDVTLATGPVVCTPTLAIEESAANEPVVPYPNPANGHVTFTGLTQPSGLQLFDYSGRCILSKRIMSGETISLKDHAAGIYFYRIQLGERLFRGKLVIL